MFLFDLYNQGGIMFGIMLFKILNYGNKNKKIFLCNRKALNLLQAI